jgi:hypothetical protein
MGLKVGSKHEGPQGVLLSHDIIPGQLCHRPLGVPGKEEQINIVLFVNEN